MQKLDIIGLIVIALGTLWFMWIQWVWKYNTDINWLLLTVIQIGIGIGLLVIPRLAKRKKENSLEQKENIPSTQTSKDFQNTNNSPVTPDSKNDRKCKVCGTNIPTSAKKCPGCGDIYS